ncbi:hypothetical protein BGZ47_001612 [Haplosporangium gracile]|nr:hypothetical protein BGZ47_001593 [Haplosporangium gracile]KAF8948897.1 hypothetical protein BGZ47_001612 [Haplosporangium gracile]
MTTRQPSEAIRSSVRRPQRFPSQLQQPQQSQPHQQQQQHHHQYQQQQQQQQQPQSTVHLEQPYQHQSFLFDADFDLVGPLGAGFSTGSSADNSSSSNDHSNINNNNGGRGHSGGTNAKSSVVKSTPLTSAKPERADTKFDPITSMPGHNLSSFFGASDDPLMTTDTDAQPFIIDFENADRFKKGTSSTLGREPKKAAVTPLQTPQPQESPSLGMLDDIFQPTLGIAAAPSRPVAKAAPARERQLPQHKQQQQQQQQTLPPPLQRQSQTHQQLLQQQQQQQQHHDSSLDFFSSLDSLSPTRSTSSSSRTSPSASFAHLGSNAPLPSFPSIPAAYSAFGRNITARKTAPVRKPSQSSNTTSSTIKDTGSPLEAVSSSSAPLSALADVFVSIKGSELRPSSSPATSNTSSTGSRKKSDATISMSASITSSKSSASTLASSAISPAGQAVSKTPSRSTSSSNMSSATSSPSASPSLAPVTAPPKPAPKMPARILNFPQHPTLTPLPTQNTSARIDPIAPPQFPSSPWDDDDDDFYQAAIPPSPVTAPTVKAASRKVVEPVVQAPSKHTAPLKQTATEHQQPQQQQQPPQRQQQLKQPKQDYQKQDHPKLKQPAHQPPQSQPQPQSQPKQEQQQAPAKARNQASKPLAPEHDKALDAKHEHGTSSAPPSPSALSPDSLFMARYPPPPPSILYSDDQITVSSLHLTIHSFYFPLNTPVTIPLLTITEMDTLPSENQVGGGNGGGSSGGGVTSWLKYKNWGVSTALTDIWWARDYKPSETAATGAGASSRSADKENTPPLVYVVVRVEGEWLRKGFGVQQEQGVKVLKDAWKNVKENERGLRPLRPATMGMEEDDGGFMIERPPDDQSLSNQSGGRIAVGGDSGAEKRRWLNYQNTWTAYPFADDSPQFLAQQQRRGATLKAPRYHQQQLFLRSKVTAAAGGGNVYLGPEESCGDEPLFIDNDLNIHEEI